MTNLPERLRLAAPHMAHKDDCAALNAAADEIEQLQKSLGECSGALEIAGHPIEWHARINAAVAA